MITFDDDYKKQFEGDPLKWWQAIPGIIFILIVLGGWPYHWFSSADSEAEVIHYKQQLEYAKEELFRAKVYQYKSLRPPVQIIPDQEYSINVDPENRKDQGYEVESCIL